MHTVCPRQGTSTTLRALAQCASISINCVQACSSACVTPLCNASRIQTSNSIPVNAGRLARAHRTQRHRRLQTRACYKVLIPKSDVAPASTYYAFAAAVSASGPGTTVTLDCPTWSHEQAHQQLPGDRAGWCLGGRCSSNSQDACNHLASDGHNSCCNYCCNSCCHNSCNYCCHNSR